jgi:hypothetical protein
VTTLTAVRLHVLVIFHGQLGPTGIADLMVKITVA